MEKLKSNPLTTVEYDQVGALCMNTGKPTRELAVGEIVSTTFHLYSARFLLFVTPYLLGAVVIGILSAAVYAALTFPPTPPAGADPTTFWNWFGLFISTVIVLAILLGIISLVVGVITSGTVTKCVSDVLEKDTANLQEGFRFAVSKLPSLIGAQLLTSILIGIGFLLLFVPGIILAIMFSLTIPTIIIEQVGAFESLGRSRRLVSNRWGTTFALLLVLIIIVLGASWIAILVVTPFGPLLGPFNTIVSNLIASFVSPILPIGITLLYYSMRAREIPPPPPPPPPF